jgi:hypothetical protein
MDFGNVIRLDRREQEVEGRADPWLARDANVTTDPPHERAYLP